MEKSSLLQSYSGNSYKCTHCKYTSVINIPITGRRGRIFNMLSLSILHCMPACPASCATFSSVCTYWPELTTSPALLMLLIYISVHYAQCSVTLKCITTKWIWFWFKCLKHNLVNSAEKSNNRLNAQFPGINIIHFMFSNVCRQLSYVKECCEGEPEGEGVCALTSEERTRWAKVGGCPVWTHWFTSQPIWSKTDSVLFMRDTTYRVTVAGNYC